jgi:hypothetical protein
MNSDAKPAFQSLTLKSVAALAVAFVASRLNIALPEGAAQDIVAAAIDLIGTLGLIGAAVGRVRAKAPIA